MADKRKSDDRRFGFGRRMVRERRKDEAPVPEDQRSGKERRSGSDRRSKDRRASRSAPEP